MKRKALLRDGDHFDVLEEGEFQAEKALQEALKRNPEVLPVADLELDEVVVFGRETSFQAYTGNWPLDAAALADFRRRLAEATPFKPSGEFTNILHVNDKATKSANAALEFMWREVAQMMEAARK